MTVMLFAWCVCVVGDGAGRYEAIVGELDGTG